MLIFSYYSAAVFPSDNIKHVVRIYEDSLLNSLHELVGFIFSICIWKLYAFLEVKYLIQGHGLNKNHPVFELTQFNPRVLTFNNHLLPKLYSMIIMFLDNVCGILSFKLMQTISNMTYIQGLSPFIYNSPSKS